MAGLLPGTQFVSIYLHQCPLYSLSCASGYILGGVLAFVALALAGGFVYVRWRRQRRMGRTVTKMSEMELGRSSPPVVVRTPQLPIRAVP